MIPTQGCRHHACAAANRKKAKFVQPSNPVTLQMAVVAQMEVRLGAFISKMSTRYRALAASIEHKSHPESHQHCARCPIDGLRHLRVPEPVGEQPGCMSQD